MEADAQWRCEDEGCSVIGERSSRYRVTWAGNLDQENGPRAVCKNVSGSQTGMVLGRGSVIREDIR
jgi:hypothetical protein